MSQELLFEIAENWKDEWQGMPEFIQEDMEPVQQIIISFGSYDDVKDFAKLLDQNLTYKTKSVWFPAVKKGQFVDYVYSK